MSVTGRPKEVIPSTSNLVQNISNALNVDQYYIGRTNDLTATKSRHGCEAIYSIYETSSPDNAQKVEDVLIKTFHSDPKCNNTANHGGGNKSWDFTNHVYVAVWFKQE